MIVLIVLEEKLHLVILYGLQVHINNLMVGGLFMIQKIQNIPEVLIFYKLLVIPPYIITIHYGVVNLIVLKYILLILEKIKVGKIQNLKIKWNKCNIK